MFLILFIFFFVSSAEDKIPKALQKEIIIKPMTINEQKTYLSIHEDPRVKNQNTAIDHNISLKHKQRYFVYLIENSEILRIYGIWYKDICVGYVGFFDDVSQPKDIFIYYAVMPQYWNLGIGTIAIKLFLNLLENKVRKNGYTRILATIKIENLASKKILEKNHFKCQPGIKMINNFAAYIVEKKI